VPTARWDSREKRTEDQLAPEPGKFWKEPQATLRGERVQGPMDVPVPLRSCEISFPQEWRQVSAWAAAQKSRKLAVRRCVERFLARGQNRCVPPGESLDEAEREHGMELADVWEPARKDPGEKRSSDFRKRDARDEEPEEPEGA